MAGFGNEVTWLSMGSRGKVAERELAGLQAVGVQVVDGRLRDVECRPGQGVAVELYDGQVLGFDVLYQPAVIAG